MDGNYNQIKFSGHSSNLSPQISSGHCQTILMYFFGQFSLPHSYLLILLLDLHHFPHSPLMAMLLCFIDKMEAISRNFLHICNITFTSRSNSVFTYVNFQPVQLGEFPLLLYEANWYSEPNFFS